MKVAIAQLNYIPGDISYNSKKIIASIDHALSKHCDLIIFSELAITGYPPLDLILRKDIISASMAAVKEIASHCQGIAAIVGGPSMNTGESGKSLYNSAFFMQDGEVKTVVNKALLPTYDVFDENRYFQSGTFFRPVDLNGTKIAITICEDIWDEQPYGDMGMWHLYSIAPLNEIMKDKDKPSLIINIAASPFSYNKMRIREEVFVRNAQKYGVPLISVNQIGGYTELIFDGSSVLIDADGTLLEKLAFCEEDLRIIETPSTGHNKDKYTYPALYPDDMTSYIHKALVTGIRDFFRKGGLKKAVIGLSGGIDSAVVLALASEALGTENVLALMMPSLFSSEHSISDSKEMVRNLGVPWKIVSIEEARQIMDKTLNPFFEGKKPDITEENIQARIRGLILMAFSNKFGYVVLNTSNKSEAATGYGTLYGDMIGGLSVIGDVYKTDVYHLAKEINSSASVIPEAIIIKPPSAELKPDQFDSDTLPPYDILDPLLYRYIDLEHSASQLAEDGFDPVLIEKVVKLIQASEFKRKQSPPILRISSKAFGTGRRIPIISKYH